MAYGSGMTQELCQKQLLRREIIVKLNDIYKIAIETGIDNDPRGRERALKILEKRKKAFSELSEKGKKNFDLDKLETLYADSGIHFGDPEKEIKTVLVGIDIGVEEILLAKELERNGKKIDLVIAHHPEGKALAN